VESRRDGPLGLPQWQSSETASHRTQAIFTTETQRPHRGLRPQPKNLWPKETKKAEKQEEDIETARKPSLFPLFRFFSFFGLSPLALPLRQRTLPRQQDVKTL
jgi:hypothetical protein